MESRVQNVGKEENIYGVCKICYLSLIGVKQGWER